MIIALCMDMPPLGINMTGLKAHSCPWSVALPTGPAECCMASMMPSGKCIGCASVVVYARNRLLTFLCGVDY